MLEHDLSFAGAEPVVSGLLYFAVNFHVLAAEDCPVHEVVQVMRKPAVARNTISYQRQLTCMTSLRHRQIESEITALSLKRKTRLRMHIHAPLPVEHRSTRIGHIQESASG